MKKIVNIEEVYSADNQASRINNQIAILKSDDVIDYIVNDKVLIDKFQKLFRGLQPSLIQRLFIYCYRKSNKKELIKKYLNTIKLPDILIYIKDIKIEKKINSELTYF